MTSGREIAVYDGRDRLGAIIARTGSVDAFDVTGVHLGSFANIRAAKSALIHRAGPACDLNARRDNTP